MRVTRPTNQPAYCSECNAGDAYKVRFQNPAVVQQGSFALCKRCAEGLASRLIQKVSETRRAPTTETPSNGE